MKGLLRAAVLAVLVMLPASSEAAPISIKGVASTYGPGYDLLAVPKRSWLGHTVRVCYKARCITRIANDYGPSQRVHPGRVADLSVKDFEWLCKCAWRTGLIKNVTVTLVK